MDGEREMPSLEMDRERDRTRVVSEMPRGKRVPLNSRRLTAVHLRQLAEALELPAVGSADEIRQVIEGKLQSSGYEVANVQVILEESSLIQTKIFLEGEGGRILETNPLTRASKDLNTELEELGEALEQEQALNTELTVKLSEYESRTPSSMEEVSKLKDDLKGEREKSKRMWRMNCEQVKMHDELMMEKASEIERLRKQLRLLR